MKMSQKGLYGLKDSPQKREEEKEGRKRRETGRVRGSGSDEWKESGNEAMPSLAGCLSNWRIADRQAHCQTNLKPKIFLSPPLSLL